jgi:hypothetical protein
LLKFSQSTPPPRGHSLNQNTGSSALRKLLIAHSLFTLITIWVAVQQATNFDQALARGMFIPDVVNMTQTFDNLWRLYSTLPFDPAFSGVSIIYGWTWLISPTLSWLINNLIMFSAGLVFIKYLAPRIQLGGWAVLVVYANPYVVLAAVGPNKEIPLILMSLIWISLLISSHQLKLPLAFLISFLAYFLRDGFGFILLMATVFYLMWGRMSNRAPISMLLFGAFVSATFGTLASYSDTLSRNLAALEQGFDQGTAIGAIAAGAGLNQLSITGGLALYLVRIIYNSLVLGIFPNFNTVFGYWNLLGISYWINGIYIIISIISSLIALTDRNTVKSANGLVFLFFLTCLFAVSISQFVQPRYLMPALPIGLSAALCLPSEIRKRVFVATLSLTLLIILLYGLAGRRPSPEFITQIEPPAFIWFD